MLHWVNSGLMKNKSLFLNFMSEIILLLNVFLLGANTIFPRCVMVAFCCLHSHLYGALQRDFSLYVCSSMLCEPCFASLTAGLGWLGQMEATGLLTWIAFYNGIFLIDATLCLM